MSCMYDVMQSPHGDVTHIDLMAHLFDTLSAEVDGGHVFLSEYPNQRRVLIFFQDADVTKMPADIEDKLQKAWVSVFEGPYDVQTEGSIKAQNDTKNAVANQLDSKPKMPFLRIVS